MKKLVSLILALAAALSLTGAAFAEEPVTITYAIFSASGAQEETLKKMVEVFEEKNPDIKVDVQLTGYDDYFTKLATTVGGGNAPDVFEMNMENFLAYMLRGACADLTGLVDPASYSEGTLSAVSSDGKLYAVPMSFSTCVLFYNKALFDQAGIDYPDDTWTWTEAQAAAEKIKALGGEYLEKIRSCIAQYNYIGQDIDVSYSLLQGRAAILGGLRCAIDAVSHALLSRC